MEIPHLGMTEIELWGGRVDGSQEFAGGEAAVDVRGVTAREKGPRGPCEGGRDPTGGGALLA